MEPEAYRVADFCRIYALSRATFYREAKACRLRPIKRGRRTLVARTEAERWFSTLKAPSAPETI